MMRRRCTLPTLKIRNFTNNVMFRFRLIKLALRPVGASEVLVQFAKAHTLFVGINRYNGQVYDWFKTIRSVEVVKFQKQTSHVTHHQFFIVEQRYLQGWTTSVLNLLELSNPKYKIVK